MHTMHAKNLAGMLASLMGAGLTLTGVEQWMRISGAFVGLVIGVLTTINILRKWRQK